MRRKMGLISGKPAILIALSRFNLRYLSYFGSLIVLRMQSFLTNLETHHFFSLGKQRPTLLEPLMSNNIKGLFCHTVT